MIEQLQGFEFPAGEWERLFAERVESYRPEWLDDLCLSGEVVWGRLSVVEPAAENDDPAAGEPRRSGKTPSRRTPITFMLRQDLPWLLQAHRGGAVPAEPTAGSGREVLDALRGRGALFHSDLQAITHRLPTEVEEGLWDGVARGLITADGFNAVRSLLHARTRFARRQRPRRRPGLPRPAGHMAAGRGGPLDAAARRPSRSTTSRSWPRPSPGSSCCDGAWCSATSTSRSGWPFRGARSSGRCAGSRPAAWSAAAISSPA